jgi:hypothetical protein
MGKAPTPENAVKWECLRYLNLRQIYCWSNPSGAVWIRPGKFMSFGLKGSSDIFEVLPDGKILCVECKSEHGRLSPEQRQFLTDIKALGGMAIVARSYRDIEAALMEAGYTGIIAGPLFDEGDAHG